MKNYVIIDADTIQKRIEELENVIEEKKIGVENERWLKHELKQILSQSTPLIPEIEKAFDEGKGVGIISYQPQGHTIDKELYNERKKHYITNLKLDI